MKKSILILGILSIVGFCGQTWAMTPTLDGILDEWTGDDVINLGSAGPYTLLATWDEMNLYIGMDRDSSDRYLGDTYLDHDSFFVAIDVDGIAGSGGASDGYGTVGFAGTMLPDLVYCYAGGDGWYESCSWDGSAWDFSAGWSNAGTYYGWSDTNPDDELTIPLSAIGGSHEVMVWSWMTTEGVYDATEASWPGGSTGLDPVMGDGLMVGKQNIPYAPVPANSEVVGINLAALSWKNPDPNNPANAITCDVWILDAGTEQLTQDPNMGPDIFDTEIGIYTQLEDDAAVESTSVQPPDYTLIDDHYYYWAVHSTDPNDGKPVTTQGNVWYFFTGDAAPVPGKPVDQYMWLSQDDSAYDGGQDNPNVRWFQVTATYTDDGKSVVDANFVNLSWGWDPDNLEGNGAERGITEVSDIHTPGVGGGTVTAIYKTEYNAADPNYSTDLPGYWDIQLQVTDGTGTAYGISGHHQIWETCGEAAASDPSDDFDTYAGHDGQYDTNSDCIINIVDFADFAEAWLNQGVKYE